MDEREIVGREDELAALYDFLVKRERLHGAAIVEGEAGIGKTTVWAAAVEACRAQSYRVLSCRPSESEALLSFAALRDLIEPLAPGILEILPGPQKRALAVALLLEEPHGAPPGPGAVAAGFLGVLRHLSTTAPVLVGVDDVQWLDRPSAAVLEFAVRRLTDEPVGLVLSFRSAGEQPAPLGLDRALGEDHLLRLPLRPLSMGAIHRMLHQHLGLTCARPLLRRLHEVSAGNPFYALELARAVLRSGTTPEPGLPLPVPSSLRGLVSDRLAALGPDVQEVLLAVAVLSDPSIPILAKVAGPKETEDAIAVAVDAGILRRHGERIGFTHPMLASGTYLEASDAHRRVLHRRLAEVVDDPQERARHLSMSTDRPSIEVAKLVEEAAAGVWKQGAPYTAGELCERAARLTPAEPIDESLRLEVAAATYYFEAGDTEAATRVLQGVISSSNPGLRAQAQCRLARIHLFTDDLARAKDAFEAALHGATDPHVRIEGEEGLAWNLVLLREDISGAAHHAGAAVALAEEHGEMAALAESLSICALAEFLLGHAGASESLMKRGLRLGPFTEDVPRVMRHPSLAHGVILVASDNFDAGLRVFRGMVERAEERGDESAHTRLLLCLSNIEFLAGNWARAEAYAIAAEEIAAQTGQYAEQGNMLYDRGVLDAHIGNLDAARRRASGGLERPAGDAAVSGMIARRILGMIALTSDDPAAAADQLAPLVQRFETASVVEPGVAPFYPDYIEALISLGRFEEAEEVLARYQRRAEKLHRLSALAASWRCRGILSAARGRHEDAASAFERALVYHDQVRMPFERARTLLNHGISQRRAKQKRAARTQLEGARDMFEQLGARFWAEKASAELSRIGGRAPHDGSLTPSEERVAALAAEGLTTKQIAGRLFVSTKTVEGHLSHIYLKLGVRSRAELAHRFATRSGDDL